VKVLTQTKQAVGFSAFNRKSSTKYVQII